MALRWLHTLPGARHVDAATYDIYARPVEVSCVFEQQLAAHDTQRRLFGDEQGTRQPLASFASGMENSLRLRPSVTSWKKRSAHAAWRHVAGVSWRSSKKPARAAQKAKARKARRDRDS